MSKYKEVVAMSMDKKWQAESDARCLAEAKGIMGDPKRMVAAAKAAKVMVADQQKQVSALKSVSRKAK